MLSSIAFPELRIPLWELFEKELPELIDSEVQGFRF